MDKRWQVSEDGTTWSRDVTVKNGAKVTITESRDLEAGQIFFRKKLNTSLLFGEPDFQYFLSFERSAMRRCKSLYIRCQLKCAQSWTTLWTGEFSTGSGKWDLGLCLFEVKPETVDKYQCILRDEDTKRNVLEAPAVLTLLYGGPGVEWYGCTFNSGDPACAAPAGTGWTFLDDYVVPGTGGGVFCRVWVRKRLRTICESGAPVAPPGGGWTLLSDDCATNGTSTHVKGLTGGEIASLAVAVGDPNLHEGTCSGGVAIQPAPVIPGGVFILVLPCTDPTYPSMWLAFNDLGEYEDIPAIFGGGLTHTGRTGQSIMELFIEASECETIPGVRSDFLEWNPPGNAPGYVAGVNYVTGQPSQTSGLVIVQKSDAILPNATNPATRGEMSLAEFFTALRVIYRLYWDIDAQGYIRIEHWKYWTSAAGIDLRTFPGVNEPQVYTHKKEKIPRYERAKWMESNGEDFVGLDIIYDSLCATTQDDSARVDSISPGTITTDVDMIADPQLVGKVSKEGFVWLACEYDNGAFSTIIDQGELSGDYKTNAPLSWANVQRDFWTWDRKLRAGNMNGNDVTFDGFLPNIEQDELSIALCCEMLQFNARRTMTSALGVSLGATAVCEEVTHDLFANKTYMKLTYAY